MALELALALHQVDDGAHCCDRHHLLHDCKLVVHLRLCIFILKLQMVRVQCVPLRVVPARAATSCCVSSDLSSL